jgi:hypothetical protein
MLYVSLPHWPILQCLFGNPVCASSLYVLQRLSLELFYFQRTDPNIQSCLLYTERLQTTKLKQHNLPSFTADTL